MNELEDYRDFLATLPDAAVEQPPPPEIDTAAAHVAASFTELKMSVQQLHADLAQRCRSLEAKVGDLSVRVETSTPNWKLLAAEILKASERGGKYAADQARSFDVELAQSVNRVVEARTADIRIFRKFSLWVALPTALLGLILLLAASYNAAALPPILFIVAAFILGAGLVVFTLHTKARWSGWISTRRG